MDNKLINIGFSNLVVADRVVAILTPDSAPMRRLKEKARSTGKLIDATCGRRTRAILVTDSDHVILSAVLPDTISGRFVSKERRIE